MSNAAIFFHADAFDTTSAKLMGRQSAGESFLRGLLRHSTADQFYFWNWSTTPIEQCDALVRRIEPTAKPVTWFKRQEFARISEVGCLFTPGPSNAQEAWIRRVIGPNRYSICALTHTTASENVMDAIVDMVQAPVEPWDTLICTSRAVTASVAAQQAMALDYFRERFGPVTPPQIRLDTIPLGINTADFARDPAHRARWRSQLGIGDDDIAVLYVGRFSMHAKMNPVPMAMALERAAQRTTRKVHWVLAGWASNDFLHAAYAEAGPRHAPSVTTHVLDGRLPEVRFPIWSAGDVFLSLSDNIQETFGLTPVEAMAAGLPSVISDWNGYRDLIEHGVQGFRVPTFAPRPGIAGDITMQFSAKWGAFDHYVGATSQFVSVDIEAAADALQQLFDNPDLRARMGEAAQRRARDVFDWAAVIPQYEALWAELDAIRKAAPVKPVGGLSPWRPDPFALFAEYPTQALPASARVTLTPGVTVQSAQAMLQDPTVQYIAGVLLGPAELAVLIEAIPASNSATVAELLARTPPPRRGVAERTILWMAKFGLAGISPKPDVTARFGV